MPRDPNNPPTPTWLVDWTGAERGRQGAIKWGVLEQLGRMAFAGYPDAVIRQLAAEIEIVKPTAKAAEARLRQIRLEVA